MKDQVRGRAEEIKGKITGNRREEMRGKARQVVLGTGGGRADRGERWRLDQTHVGTIEYNRTLKRGYC